MPTMSSKALAEIIQRDEQIIDALQMARYILSGKDVEIDPRLRALRAKLAVIEAQRFVEAALKLMELRRW